MKQLVVATIASFAVCACAADPASSKQTPMYDKPRLAQAAAPAGCTPPPKELVVKDLAPGTGEDSVRFRTAIVVGYTGWLYDGCKPDFKGEKFDTTEGKAAPFSFMAGAGRVIKGWDEGVIGMKEHGRRLLIIPPDKAYGDRQAGPIIKPNSTLVFEVELLKILVHADAPPAGAAIPPANK